MKWRLSYMRALCQHLVTPTYWQMGRAARKIRRDRLLYECKLLRHLTTRSYLEPIRGDIYLWRIGLLTAEQALGAIEEWIKSALPAGKDHD